MDTSNVNMVVPEDTDTEKVAATSVTVTADETLDVGSAQTGQCRAEAYASRVSQAERMVKGSRVNL